MVQAIVGQWLRNNPFNYIFATWCQAVLTPIEREAATSLAESSRYLRKKTFKTFSVTASRRIFASSFLSSRMNWFSRSISFPAILSSDCIVLFLLFEIVLSTLSALLFFSNTDIWSLSLLVKGRIDGKGSANLSKKNWQNCQFAYNLKIESY